MHNYWNKIKSLQSKIEFALKSSDFDKLADLSKELESSVKALADDPYYNTGITPKELDDLRNLLLSIEKYQKETPLKFKDYTLEFSQKRKMHQAYRR